MKKVTKIHAKIESDKQKKLRVAAYCRVSTAFDKQLESLDIQKSHYESYINSRDDWELVDIYYDEGISGTKKAGREGLLRMLNDCENGLIDFIITKSISRFARNTADCLEMIRKLMEFDVGIYFEKENINTKSMEGEFMLSTLSSLAEDESASISMNMKWSIDKRFKNGSYIIISPPYGYKNVDGKMVVVDEQAEVVKRIFHDCLNGKGSYKIAKELNDEGIPTMKSCKWYQNSVLSILHNENYTGAALFQKTYTDDEFNRHINNGEKVQYLIENHHEAIISKEIFNKAQQLMEIRSSEKGNGTNKERYTKRYAMSGKIICGNCGDTFKRRIHNTSTRRYIAWCCNTHLTNKEACSMKYIENEALENAFMTMMNKLKFGRDKILKKLYSSVSKINSEEVCNEMIKIDADIKSIEEQMDTVHQLLDLHLLDNRVYKEEISRLEMNVNELTKKRDSLVNLVNEEDVNVGALEVLIKCTSGRVMYTIFDEEVFEKVVDKVVVIDRYNVEFHLKSGLHLKERLVRK